MSLFKGHLELLDIRRSPVLVEWLVREPASPPHPVCRLSAPRLRAGRHYAVDLGSGPESFQRVWPSLRNRSSGAALESASTIAMRVLKFISGRDYA